jgi:tight adherence protein C
MDDLLAILLFQDPALRLAGLLLWGALALMLAYAATGQTRAQRLRERVRARIAGDETIEKADRDRPPIPVRLAQHLLDRRLKAGSRPARTDDSLALKMWRAGFYGAAAPAWWIVWRIASVPLGAGIVAVILLGYAGEGFSPRTAVTVGAIIGAALGLVGPPIYRRNRTDRRMMAIRKAWPDLLDLLALTVGAGLTLETALLRIRDLMAEKAPDLARELTILTAELTYFGERALALQNLNKRCDMAEVDDLVTALIQADQKGLPLSGLLTNTAREQRRKRRMEIEKKAASLPAKLTVPMILFFLPALLIVILAPIVFRVGDIF